jgi:hypothetical protein
LNTTLKNKYQNDIISKRLKWADKVKEVNHEQNFTHRRVVILKCIGMCILFIYFLCAISIFTSLASTTKGKEYSEATKKYIETFQNDTLEFAESWANYMYTIITKGICIALYYWAIFTDALSDFGQHLCHLIEDLFQIFVEYTLASNSYY